MSTAKHPCILYLSSFPPRECGIATFTQDLTNAIDKEFCPSLKSKILAINDNGTSIYNYPKKVLMQIRESNMEDYIDRAYEINRNHSIKLVNIQHEYGLFGGEWGDFLLTFLELLKKPVVVTFHTVLPNPKEKVKRVTVAIAKKAVRIVVMTHHSARLLEKFYGIDKDKISIVPHGVHHIPFPSKTRAKKKLNLSGRTILSTFGMLNRDKGIEYAIEALPEVIKEFPNVLYLVLGATHPVVRKQEGERYRNMLKKIIKKHGLQDYVKFYDKYLSLEELIDFLKATDIYLSPTLNPRQAVSGTISYALSCACPIIATANQYATDVINAERGILVRFKNSLDIQDGLFKLLRDNKLRKEMKKNTYFYSRHMTWQNVALSYFNTFNKVAKMRPQEKDKMPPINLAHIRKLTDKFGIIQFANHTKPDIHSGYCLDDNIRALLSTAMYYKANPNRSVMNLMQTYFDFVKFAQKPNGRFHNFVGYNKNFNDITESEDSYGRTIWTLGYLIKSDHIPEHIRKEAKTILNKALKWADDLISLRAIAFTMLGLTYVYESDKSEKNLNLIKKLAKQLTDKFKHTCSATDNTWPWFEDCLTYSNYKLTEALFRAYQATGEKEFLDVAEKALTFLNKVTFEKKYFSPIGQDGWYFRGQKRAYFDQQPEDAASAVESLMTAYEATKKQEYLDKAKLSFEWFLGKNHLNQMVYDEATGGSYDGLGRFSLNFNQGAESTISYLLARLAIENIK